MLFHRALRRMEGDTAWRDWQMQVADQLAPIATMACQCAAELDVWATLAKHALTNRCVYAIREFKVVCVEGGGEGVGKFFGESALYGGL